MDSKLTPEQALEHLAGGNQRFAGGGAIHPHAGLSRMVELAREGQAPVAVVLSCADSRVPPELIFDQGLGDLFVARVAGNLATPEMIATVEFGVEHVGIPLVVVLGHSQCVAIANAYTGKPLTGSLPGLIEQITPAVERVRQRRGSTSETELLLEAVRENVWQSVEGLLFGSEIVRQAVRAGELQVWGAVYSLESCLVDWLGRHPDEPLLLAADAPVATPDRPEAPD